MLNFPKSAYFGKVIPKESFYRNLNLTSQQKDKFVSDIKKITWQYKLSPTTINTEKGENTSEILVLLVELKVKDFDTKILELISKQNAHQVLYLLQFEDNFAFSLFETKLYTTSWQSKDDLALEIQGVTLDLVWQNFVASVEGGVWNVELSLTENLLQHEQQAKLQKQIAALENKLKNTKQYNLQVKLKKELKKLKEIYKE